MKKIIASLAVAFALMSSAATAQERAGDAALGALSGAVLLGPVGAVAGALVGYTAGPSIANAWGVRPSSRPQRVRRTVTARPNANLSENLPASRSRADMPTATAMPATPGNAQTAPPVQPLE